MTINKLNLYELRQSMKISRINAEFNFAGQHYEQHLMLLLYLLTSWHLQNVWLPNIDRSAAACLSRLLWRCFSGRGGNSAIAKHKEIKSHSTVSRDEVSVSVARPSGDIARSRLGLKFERLSFMNWHFGSRLTSGTLNISFRGLTMLKCKRTSILIFLQNNSIATHHSSIIHHQRIFLLFVITTVRHLATLYLVSMSGQQCLNMTQQATAVLYLSGVLIN